MHAAVAQPECVGDIVDVFEIAGQEIGFSVIESAGARTSGSVHECRHFVWELAWIDCFRHRGEFPLCSR